MNTTYDDVYKTISASNSNGKRTFVKDMAQYIVRLDAQDNGENPTIYSDEQLRKWDHAFLIRTPTRAVPSYYRCCTGDNSNETEFAFYDPAEAGYRELRLIYNYVKKLNPSQSFSIVDSEDLTSHPTQVLETFCKENGIPWDPKMTSWSAGEVEEFKSWPGFHVDVEQSTGFHKPKKYDEVLPQMVLDTIEVNMPIYKYLEARKLQIGVPAA